MYAFSVVCVYSGIFNAGINAILGPSGSGKTRYICVSVYLCVCMYVCIHVCMHACVCVCVYCTFHICVHNTSVELT